jgi:hypothetical protein
VSDALVDSSNRIINTEQPPVSDRILEKLEILKQKDRNLSSTAGAELVKHSHSRNFRESDVSYMFHIARVVLARWTWVNATIFGIFTDTYRRTNRTGKYLPATPVLEALNHQFSNAKKAGRREVFFQLGSITLEEMEAATSTVDFLPHLKRHEVVNITGGAHAGTHHFVFHQTLLMFYLSLENNVGIKEDMGELVSVLADW